MNTISLYGEGGAVNRNDPELLASLERLYAIVNEYDASCVYNMDEMGLFFLLVPRYTMLLPSEDPTTIWFTLIVCCNAIRTGNIHIMIIGKAKEPAYLLEMLGHYLILHKEMFGLISLALISGLIKCLYMLFILELIAGCF